MQLLRQKKRILTGDRPTGRLHLGHYVGSLKNRVALQDEYETFIINANVQALTDNFDNPKKVKDNILEVTMDNLAVGLDPEKVTFFIQSEVPEIAELTIFFANLVTVASLSHNPTVKTEMKEKGMEKNVPLGFYMYPVSQAADISFIDADLVPVGKDQLPHIEQTRKLVRRFNEIYGDTLVEPEALVGNDVNLPGIDGNAKMSKSLNNAIYLSDSPEIVQQKVRSMYTDPNRVHGNEPGQVEGNPVFMYHDAFNPNLAEVEELKARYRQGDIKDVEVKDKLTTALKDFLEPIREKRVALEQKPDEVMEILMEGTKKTRVEAAKTLERVKEAMKIRF